MDADRLEKIREIVDAAPEQLKYKIWDKLTGANRLREARRQKHKLAYEKARCHRRRSRRDEELTSDEITSWFIEYKSSLSCEECGETDSSCLVFHHVDRSTKRAAVASMVRSKSSKQEILDEIAKCVVLCSNCHAKLHRSIRESSK